VVPLALGVGSALGGIPDCPDISRSGRPDIDGVQVGFALTKFALSIIGGHPDWLCFVDDRVLNRSLVEFIFLHIVYGRLLIAVWCR